MAFERLQDSNRVNAGDFIGECAVTQSCEPCMKTNVSKTATFFCKDCDEYLCETCKNPHTVYKPGQHIIVNVQDNTSAPVIIDMKGMDKCHEHAREIEFFCQDHSKLCCLSCVLIHRKCDQLDEIVKVSRQTRPDLRALKQSLIKLQSDADAIIAECKQSETGLNESIAMISSEVDKMKDRIKQLFAGAKQKLISEAKQFKTAEVKRIWNKRDASLKVKEELKKVLSMCCVVLERGTPSQQYIYSELMKEKQNTLESTIDDQRKITCSSTMTVSFPKQVTSLLEIGSNSIKLNYDGNKTDVESVFDMCPLKMMGKKLIVERFGSSDANEKSFNRHSKSSTVSMFDSTQTHILVEDIPHEVDEEMLEMCFSSRKLRSCTIEDIDIDEVDNNAVIKFSRPQGETDSAEMILASIFNYFSLPEHELVDVKTVLDNLPITIKKREVSVQIYVPKKLCTVIVHGPEGVMKEKYVVIFELYFENKKKSGGGDIQEISFRSSDKAFYIVYKEEYVAKRVVERDDHSIMKNKVKVELFKPRRSTKVSYEPINERSTTIYERNKEYEHVVPASQPLKTVKIRGVCRVSYRDSVQWYFENKKKSDGGEIESRFTDEEDDDVMYLKFKDESVAQAVAKRQHKLGGQELVVSLYTPPVPQPSYPNKLLIKGLNPKITFDVLDMFLEARAGITLLEGSMTYHAEQEDVVLVTVYGDIDFAKLEEACRLKALEGSHLRVSQVPISNCVLVSNISDTVTVNMVSLYFENEKRSNGGQVDKVEMFSTQNYCLVYFADYKVVDRVLSKDHKLDGRQLEVRRYCPCIGRAEGDTVERRFKKPNPLIVQANIQKMKFLHRSSVSKLAIEKQLSMCHATIIWPVANDSEDVELRCTLSEDVQDCVKLAKDWNDNAKASFQDFMNTLYVESVFVFQCILKKVTEELSKICIDNPEAVVIVIQRQENKIYIVGIKGNVLGLKTKVGQIVKDIQEASEKEKTWTKVGVNNLRSIETKMLMADKFPCQMEEKFPGGGFKIKIHPTKNEIEIEGIYSVVNTIQIEMYKIKDTFVRNESQIPHATIAMFMSWPVQQYISKKLKHDKIIAVWETVDGKLIVMSKHDTMLSKAVDIISKSVAIGKVQLTKENRSSLLSAAWAVLQKQLLEEHQAKLILAITLDEVAFVCTDDIFSKMLETIHYFLDKNTI